MTRGDMAQAGMMQAGSAASAFDTAARAFNVPPHHPAKGPNPLEARTYRCREGWYSR